MQLYKLDSAYALSDLIEGYTSLIWTERYQPVGDFELKTADIENTMAALPVGCLVSLLDTQEVMIVETHSIDAAENDTGESADVLTVTGRSFESFYENRTTLFDETNASAPQIVVNDASSMGAAAAVLTTASTASLDANNIIPNVGITTSNFSGVVLQPDTDRFIERGSAYDAVIKILQEENLGIRNNRPDSFRTTLDTNVYIGRDLSTSIILDVKAGHFVGNVRYLWSIQDYKTAAYVASHDGYTRRFVTGMAFATGLDHRVGLIDVPEITGTGATVTKQNAAVAFAYLGEHPKVMYIEGTVATDIPYQFGYGNDYLIGDLVLVLGKYGLSQVMMVVEYVRIEDEAGERGYPTLS